MITAGQGYPVLVGDPTAEVAEYEAVLSSAHFAGETNSKRFLKFVCDKYFAGIHHISEYEIAIEALGRRSDFDTSQDSIVRVEAHRVRKRLREYYEHEGSKHTLHLVIPQGSYLPHFVPANQPESEPVADPVPPSTQVPEAHPAPALVPRSFPLGLAVLLILLVATILTTGLVVYVRTHGKAQAHRLASASTPLPQ